MQNKLCTRQFSHHPKINSLPVPEQELRNPEITNFIKLSKKTKLLKKFDLPDKRGLELMEMREEQIPVPQPTPNHTLSVPPMVQNISTGYLGLPAWPCSLPSPAHLLTGWIQETGKSPWFHSNDWKHPCYQRSSCPKSKTQQLLRGKLTLSQAKPGHTACVVIDLQRAARHPRAASCRPGLPKLLNYFQ